MKKHAFLLTLLLTFISLMAYAEQDLGSGARSALDTMHKQAASTLTGNNISDAERRSRFRALLHQWFDLNKIAQFTLGSYWRSASESERASYQKYFEDYLVLSYADSFKSYTGNSFNITGVSLRPNSDVVIVSTQIVTNYKGSNKPVKVDWRLKRTKDGTFKIKDISVENVSMSITRRKEFASVINRGGGKVSAIISELERMTKPVRLG